MSKTSRIAALESRMTAVEQHCGIAPASATLAVGDTAFDINDLGPPGGPLRVGETVGVTRRAYSAYGGSVCGPELGELLTVVAVDSTAMPGMPIAAVSKSDRTDGDPQPNGQTYWYYPASSLRRVQPAPDVQPAAYVAGQHDPVMPKYGLGQYLRCGKKLGRVIAARESVPNGRVPHYTCDMLLPPFGTKNWAEDQCTPVSMQILAEIGKMILADESALVNLSQNGKDSVSSEPDEAAPRQPAAPAADVPHECLVVPCPECGFNGGIGVKGRSTGVIANITLTRQPAAQQPESQQPAEPSIGERILHNLRDPHWEAIGDAMQASILADAIRAAAAVRPNACGDLGEETTDDATYNAGQNSILAPMLAALTQGGK